MKESVKSIPGEDLIDSLLEDDKDFAQAYGERRFALEAGAQIIAMRKSVNLTQTQLAKLVSVSQPRISQLEKGDVPQGPTYSLMKRIAEACHVSWPNFPASDQEDRKTQAS
ncbi:MAG: helix-turn-helix domain-containing protein [Alphaproteobacteria bacterium]|nr:helix-turn-helix domain-containing protein [Alphaproteobacteria bacterium]